MTTFKTALLAATALAMLSGAAAAQSVGNIATNIQRGGSNAATVDQASHDSTTNGNTSRLLQVGNNNNADVRQRGRGANNVGRDGEANFATQTGDRNVLTITQDGRFNTTGYQRTGIDQTGDRNTASIDQTGTANRLDTLQQTSLSGASATTNALTVDQDGGANVVRVVRQNNTGGAENTATIIQNGSNNRIGGALNTDITSVGQNGTANVLSVSQTGNDNILTSATQDGLSGAPGVNNQLTLTIDGNRNGLLGGFAQTQAFSSANGLALSTVSQRGSQNGLAVTITGNENDFGFSQEGSGNSILGTLNGNFSDVAGVQIGDLNSATFSSSGYGNISTFLQSGDGNTVGSTQSGNNNRSSISQTADSNSATLLQNGNSNVSSITQLSNSNTATVTQIGNSNTSTVTQGSVALPPV